MNLLRNIAPGHLGSFTWEHEPPQWEPCFSLEHRSVANLRAGR
jgi:hypothetical protein